MRGVISSRFDSTGERGIGRERQGMSAAGRAARQRDGGPTERVKQADVGLAQLGEEQVLLDSRGLGPELGERAGDLLLEALLRSVGRGRRTSRAGRMRVSLLPRTRRASAQRCPARKARTEGETHAGSRPLRPWNARLACEKPTSGRDEREDESATRSGDKGRRWAGGCAASRAAARAGGERAGRTLVAERVAVQRQAGRRLGRRRRRERARRAVEAWVSDGREGRGRVGGSGRRPDRQGA